MVNRNGDLVLRKARKEWRFAAIAVFVVFGLPFVAAAVGAAFAGEWLVVLTAGPVVAVPTIGIWGHLRFSRIIVTAHEIVVRGFVIRRRVPRARAASVVRADVLVPRAGIVDTVYVLDGAGNLLVRIYGRHYRRADFDRLIAFLGVPSTNVPGPVGLYYLAAMHPGLVPSYEARPFSSLYAGVVAAIVVIVAVVSVLLSST